MKILFKTKRSSFRTNKDQRGDLFRPHEKKGKIAALERGDFVLQEQLKSLMYIDRSVCGDIMKDNLFDELNFKH